METPKQKTIDTIMDKLTMRARAAGYVHHDSESQMRRRLNRLNLKWTSFVLRNSEPNGSKGTTPGFTERFRGILSQTL